MAQKCAQEMVRNRPLITNTGISSEHRQLGRIQIEPSKGISLKIFLGFRFEAVTEEGHTYFWHVETHESRWDPPPEGYLSIQGQEDINKKHENREMRKIEQIYVQQALHCKEEDPAEVEGPKPRPAGPYGAWQTVST